MKTVSVNNLYVVLLFYGMLLLFSCGKDVPPPGFQETTPQDYQYPLNPGYKWNYETTIEYLSPIDSLYFFEWNEVVNEKKIILANGIETVERFSKDSSDSSVPWYGSEYYRAEPAGLFFHGYLYGSNNRIFLKYQKAIYVLVDGVIYHSLADLRQKFRSVRYLFTDTDSIIIESPPLLTLKYPLTVGDEWTYRPLDKPFGIYKRVNKYTPVTVPAGKFDTYEIKFSWDADNDGLIDADRTMSQYISDKGIIKVTYNFEFETLDSLGNPIGTGIWRETSVLTKINF